MVYRITPFHSPLTPPPPPPAKKKHIQKKNTSCLHYKYANHFQEACKSVIDKYYLLSSNTRVIVTIRF